MACAGTAKKLDFRKGSRMEGPRDAIDSEEAQTRAKANPESTSHDGHNELKCSTSSTTRCA